MNRYRALQQARDVVDDFDLADTERERDALVSDDRFLAVASVYQEVRVLVDYRDSLGAVQEAADCLEEAVRENADRVLNQPER
ncbi:hypothetical protein SAMN05443574_1353 [Haloarcula vallismortis]|uniref:Uncharacterized protein n=2 Tax=Haloarcula vallismortis TaxID=28442 RepID=M0J7E4_HALVA|nr:hypothetical protein [Haloarcula vallismortis]EMA04278.1 hypothetical protein C437_13997 [Haloarcula vallismortis ATCC 29715]SDX35247.1 hypothetical protein SAMN05443574_1353 [Haloarcula vallismortis]